MTDPRFAGKSIPSVPFAGDAGEADPALVALLQGATGMDEAAAIVATLRSARLLVGLLAVLDSTEDSGGEKDSHMAAAMWQRPDGARALLAFTGVDALRRWDATARPLAVTGPTAAQAALSEGATTLLIDSRYPLVGPALWALAEDRALVAPDSDPEVQQAVARAVAEHLPQIEGRHHLVSQNWVLRVLLDRSAVHYPGDINGLSARLAEDPLVRARVAGIELAVLPQ